MSVRREDIRWRMACAIVDLEKAGWNILHVEESWIVTKSNLPRRVGGLTYQYHVFHIHPKPTTANYRGNISHIKPYKSCKRYCCMPDHVRFLFNLIKED